MLEINRAVYIPVHCNELSSLLAERDELKAQLATTTKLDDKRIPRYAEIANELQDKLNAAIERATVAEARLAEVGTASDPEMKSIFYNLEQRTALERELAEVREQYQTLLTEKVSEQLKTTLAPLAGDLYRDYTEAKERIKELEREVGALQLKTETLTHLNNIKYSGTDNSKEVRALVGKLLETAMHSTDPNARQRAVELSVEYCGCLPKARAALEGKK